MITYFGIGLFFFILLTLVDWFHDAQVKNFFEGPVLNFIIGLLWPVLVFMLIKDVIENWGTPKKPDVWDGHEDNEE